MRYYSTTAGAMVLQSAIADSDTNIVVDTTAGLPVTFPYTLLLDYGSNSEEVVDVTAAAGTTLTVQRAKDGTVAQAHAFGAVVRHGVTARDLRESREHEAATVAHGLTGEVVGTSDTQALDNKTFQPDADNAAITVRTVAANVEPALEVRTEGDTRVVELHQGDLRLTDGTNILARFYHGSLASFWKSILNLRVASDVHALVGNVSGTPTGRFLRLMNGASELFYVSAAGGLKAVTGLFDSHVTVGGNLAVTGTVSSPTITALQSADTALTAADAALDTRVDALEADSGWLPLSVGGFGGSVPVTVEYRKLRGIVYMRGAVSTFTPGAFVTLGTLPAGYRPAVASFFGSGSNSAVTMSVTVSAAGVVQVYCSATTGAYTGLSPVVFPV